MDFGHFEVLPEDISGTALQVFVQKITTDWKTFSFFFFQPNDAIKKKKVENH